MEAVGMGKCEHNNATMHGVVGVGLGLHEETQEATRGDEM